MDITHQAAILRPRRRRRCVHGCTAFGEGGCWRQPTCRTRRCHPAAHPTLYVSAGLRAGALVRL